MKAIKTDIPDILLFEPIVFGDSRGYFFEYFRQEIIEKYMPGTSFVQGNESLSTYGVIRGLHFQKPPFTQGKLVRVIIGEVLDVAVDMRVGSPTYGHHVAVHLSGENKRQLWVPKGFAHGFAVLSKEVLFTYSCDNYYHPQSDAGIRFDDPFLKINWLIPKDKVLLSEKDQNKPSFHEVNCFNYIDLKSK